MGKKDFCCAEGCSHERSKGATCAFYHIPDDPNLRKLWLGKISRVVKVVKNGKTITKPWQPSKSSKLCGCHFDNPPPPKSRKKWFLVPTIFSHRAQKEKTPRPERLRRHLSPTKKKVRSPDVRRGKNQMVSESEVIIADPGADCEESCQDVTEFYTRDNLDDWCLEDEHPLADHDYLRTRRNDETYKFSEHHPDLSTFIKESEQYKEESEELKRLTNNGQILSYKFIKGNPKHFQYYTGLYIDVFEALYTYLEDKAQVMKYPYGARTILFNHHVDSNKKKPGRHRTYSMREEMFFTLVKLRLGLQTVDCAIRFGMSPSTFSSISTAWIMLLSSELERICKMPGTNEIDITDSAKCFEEFSNVRVVIDCTELFSETPSSVGAHKQFHSNYKHHTTVKFLVGMNTGGAVTYISQMYGGRSSDKFITNESQDLLSALNPGEKVMADRGFTISSDLPDGVQLIIPSFKHKDKSQFSKRELQQNKKISEARVHIERAIRRIKQFQILKTEMKLTQKDVYENIFKACGYLVNFQDPFLKV